MSKIKSAIFLAIICGGLGACSQPATDSQKQAEQAHVTAGIAVADADDPNRWAPAPEAIRAAKEDEARPPNIVPQNAPTASSYDLNPRAAEKNAPSASPPEDAEDPALGDMERLPPPPPLPKATSGDEADQFGLPAWEKLARGELRVKRIQY